MNEWKPVTEPPALHQSADGDYKSEPVLVYTSYDTMVLGIVEKWGDGLPPVWYECSYGHLEIGDYARFWTPLPNPPYPGDKND